MGETLQSSNLFDDIFSSSHGTDRYVDHELFTRWEKKEEE